MSEPTGTETVRQSPPDLGARATVRRVEVRPKPSAGDPRGRRVLLDAERLGIPLDSARTSRLYLISAEMSDAQFEEVIDRLLANPVTEESTVGASGVAPGERCRPLSLGLFQTDPAVRKLQQKAVTT